MNTMERVQCLRKSLTIKEDKRGLKHTINKRSPILPFPTRNPERAKFSKGFDGVTGEFTRVLCGNTLNAEVDMDGVLENISKKVHMSNEDKPHFLRLIRMFLADDQEKMKVFHPHIFQYLPLSPGKESKGEEDIAQFIRDVLLGEDNALASFFAKSETDHLIARLILDQLDHLKQSEKDKRYFSKIAPIMQLFKDDMQFLSNHKDYFVEHINLFMAYYYFFYITQLTLKLNQGLKADFESINEVIYTLDWEGTSRSRAGYEKGYQHIKDAASRLLVHVNCLEHLNFLFDTTAASYGELKQTYDSMDSDNQVHFIDLLKQWIKEYRYHTYLTDLESMPNDYEELVQLLYSSLDEGIEKATKSRYALSIEEIGKKYFLKTRGALGYMLNVSQDFLLLLTAISVKNKRKSLKDVFLEFEKRGLKFDRHSQEAIVNLFDKLNLLDKKSDSGDAQYVKPIL